MSGLFFTFLISSNAQSASLQFKAIEGGYIINGRISENDLVWTQPAAFWAPLHTLVHETGTTYYEDLNTNTYCSTSKSTTVQIINLQLSKGIAATRYQRYGDQDPDFTAQLRCKVSYSDAAGGWIIKTMTPSPPGGALCDTSVPLKVSFGTLAVGTANIKTTMDGTIKCDQETDISLSFRGFDDGYIPVEDAKVKFTFDNGAPTYKLTTKKNVTTNFKVNFEEISTGTTTGYKSASAVLVMQWQ